MMFVFHLLNEKILDVFNKEIIIYDFYEGYEKEPN